MGVNEYDALLIVKTKKRSVVVEIIDNCEIEIDKDNLDSFIDRLINAQIRLKRGIVDAD